MHAGHAKRVSSSFREEARGSEYQVTYVTFRQHTEAICCRAPTRHLEIHVVASRFLPVSWHMPITAAHDPQNRTTSPQVFFKLWIFTLYSSNVVRCTASSIPCPKDHSLDSFLRIRSPLFHRYMAHESDIHES
jgi:hypothetical protein